ncbi:peptidoglycan-binding domain-containing protein [Actinomadura xylanilytica]|uniref:peptidoglycan-binding domain-containing protein n=1 Tax=Actinomadura xylanilytica TaxID=887459 RepID=UPI00255AF2F1|nr:peptidoglycan-binding domain-containing protein [Actinomadura xylanilytica]MDL4772426.1 peptidoglycan-binding domain-containing protein [Actinomadura xylanilytica]
MTGDTSVENRTDPPDDTGGASPDVSGASSGVSGTAPGASSGSGEGAEVAAGPQGVRRRRGRRRVRRSAVAVAVLGAGGAAVAAMLGLGGASTGGSVSNGLPPRTATVTRQTLNDTQTADGKLGFGTTFTATSRLPGTLTRLPESGGEITRGHALYSVDDDPVVLMYGEKPAYRTLKQGTEGPDVRRLEKNLKALGYSGFTVDDEYDADTAAAVERWQDDKGLKETGVVELGRVVFTPGPIRVDALQAGEGDPMAPGRKVLTFTGTSKAVTVDLEAADRRLAKKGAKVDVDLPDNTTVKGRIDEVSTVIEPGAGPDDDPSTKVEVIVELVGAKAQRAADAYALAAVDVTFTAGTRDDVLTVPVAALVALDRGGFGLEVVRGTGTSYVPVTAGLFAAGRVEVSGAGIAEGTVVGTAK